MLIQPTNNVTQATPSAVRATSDATPVVTDNQNVSATQTIDRQAAPQNTKAPTPEQLKDAVKIINQALQQSNQSLEFSVDSTTKTPVVKLTDTATGEVIRQFPTQQTLAISQSIDQYQHGLLLTQKA